MNAFFPCYFERFLRGAASLDIRPGMGITAVGRTEINSCLGGNVGNVGKGNIGGIVCYRIG